MSNNNLIKYCYEVINVNNEQLYRDKLITLARSDAVWVKDSRGYTPLMILCDNHKISNIGVKVVRLLKQSIACERTPDGRTAIMLAIDKGNFECVKYLIDIEGEIMDLVNNSILRYALNYYLATKESAIFDLIKNEKPLLVEHERLTPLMLNIIFNKPYTLEDMENYAGIQDNTGNTALMYFCMSENMLTQPYFDILVEKETNLQNNNEETALMLIFKNKLIKSIISQHSEELIEIVRTLSAHEVGKKNKNGETALMEFCKILPQEFNQEMVLNIFIFLRDEKEIANSEGLTYLHFIKDNPKAKQVSQEAFSTKEYTPIIFGSILHINNKLAKGNHIKSENLQEYKEFEKKYINNEDISYNEFVKFTLSLYDNVDQEIAKKLLDEEPTCVLCLQSDRVMYTMCKTCLFDAVCVNCYETAKQAGNKCFQCKGQLLRIDS